MAEKRDPYSYRGFADRHSLMLATGVGLILLGCSLSAFASLLPSLDQADSAVIAKALDEIASLATKDVVHTDFASAHVLATIVLIAFAVTGAWMLHRARNDFREFQEAYPTLGEAYSDDERRRIGRAARLLLTAAACVLGASAVFAAAGHGMTNLYADLASADAVSRASALGTGIVMLGVSVGCWLLVRGVTVRRMPDRFRYDFRSIARVSMYEIDRQTEGDLNSKLRQVRRIVARKSLANHVIVIAGALVSLSLYALPSLRTPLFWVGIICAGVASWLVSELALRRARRLFPDFDAYDFKGSARS